MITATKSRHPFPGTIRGRVALATFASLAAILLLVGLVIDRFDYYAALNAVDTRLAGDAEALAAAVDYDGHETHFDFQDEIITSFTQPRCGAYFQVFTSQGTLERSRSLDGKSLSEPGPEILAPLVPGEARRASTEMVPGPFEPAVRLRTLAIRRKPEHRGIDGQSRPAFAMPPGEDIAVVVQVARSITEIEKGWLGERLAVVSGLSLALALGTFAAFFIARRATGPIKNLTDDARVIASGGGTDRLEISAVEGELRELALLLNQGFDRLASTVAREKRFAADAAHELRTPITVFRARLEHALSRDRTPSEYRAAIQSALDASVRLQSLVEGFLMLSRADRPLEVRAGIDLCVLVRETLEGMPAVTGSPVRFEPALEPVLVAAHEELLAAMVAGLVRNAQRHGASSSGVEVSVREAGGRAELLVLDRGPGFAPEMLSRMFERLARADASRSRATGGAGLGLAIAKAIIDAHDGTITAGPRQGGGACVRVTLPLTDRLAAADLVLGAPRGLQTS
jgi:signal transduction histidine kinase